MILSLRSLYYDNAHVKVGKWGLIWRNKLKEVSYGNGKVATAMGNKSVETIPGARGGGTAL
jgi:hypothetical protein